MSLTSFTENFSAKFFIFTTKTCKTQTSTRRKPHQLNASLYITPHFKAIFLFCSVYMCVFASAFVTY